MIRSGTSTLEPFDPEIEGTFRRLRNLVKARVSPKREKPIMEETPVHTSTWSWQYGRSW